MNKNIQRETAKNNLKSLNVNIRAQSDADITKNVLSYELWKSSENILLYASFGFEISTSALIEAALSGGKNLFLPRVLKNGEMEAVFVPGVSSLSPGAFGIPEPTGDRLASPDEIDLIIVPGLAFDKTGARLGRGGGYYDRYLAKSKAKTLALCREINLFDAVCREEHDMPVSAIATELRIIETERNENNAR